MLPSHGAKTLLANREHLVQLVRRWPQALAVQARFIERGPWENGYMGPFNGKLLVREKFYTLTEAAD